MAVWEMNMREKRQVLGGSDNWGWITSASLLSSFESVVKGFSVSAPEDLLPQPLEDELLI